MLSSLSDRTPQIPFHKAALQSLVPSLCQTRPRCQIQHLLLLNFILLVTSTRYPQKVAPLQLCVTIWFQYSSATSAQWSSCFLQQGQQQPVFHPHNLLHPSTLGGCPQLHRLVAIPPSHHTRPRCASLPQLCCMPWFPVGKRRNQSCRHASKHTYYAM